MTSFTTLLAELQQFEGDLPLVFVTQDGEIGAGYHVTELRHLDNHGIDCGGQTDQWREPGCSCGMVTQAPT